MTESKSIEMYLKTLYIIRQSQPDVGVSDVSKAMAVSRPSVVRAMGVLRDKGYITQARYGKIQLTPDGQQMAEALCAANALIKSFLQDTLDIPVEMADQCACQVEHVIDHQVLDAMKVYLDKQPFAN